jgi:hypothetical protein
MKSFDDGDVNVAKVECSRRVVNVGGGRVKESQVTIQVRRGWCSAGVSHNVNTLLRGLVEGGWQVEVAGANLRNN